MSIMTSLVLFAVFIIIYTVIIEIFTVLFRLTGVTREKARTQVISLLTNCGFTTEESEIIMSAKRRRKLAQITMLCGYSFSMIIVSMMVNILLSLNQTELKNLLQSVLLTLAIMIALILLMRLHSVRSEFDLMIEKLGNRIMFGKQSNILILIDMYKERAVVEAVLDNIPAFLRGVKLGESQLKEQYGIQIMHIRRGGDVLELVDGETVLETGDSLLLFGDYKTIRQVFEHPEG